MPWIFQSFRGLRGIRIRHLHTVVMHSARGWGSEMNGGVADGVVAVAEDVPGRLLGLDVAGGVAGAAAQDRRAGAVEVEVDRPRRPGAAGFGRVETCGPPVGGVRPTHIDSGDRSVAGPRPATDTDGARGERRAGSRVDDQ